MLFKNKKIKDFTNLSIFNFLVLSLSFFTTPMIANLLGSSNFGLLSFSVSIGTYILSISYCGFEKTLVRDLLNDENQASKILFSSLFIRIFILIITYSVSIFILMNHFEKNTFLYIIVLSESLKCLYLNGFFDARDKISKNSLIFFIERLVYFSLIWIIIFFDKKSLSLEIISISSLLATLLSLFLQYKTAYNLIKFDFNIASLRYGYELLRKNLWIWSSVLAQLGFGGLSKILMLKFASKSDLGIYALAWQVVIIGSVIINQVSRIYFPILIQTLKEKEFHPKNVILFITKYQIILIAIGSFLAIFPIFLATELLSFFKPEYIEAENIIKVFGLYIIVISFNVLSNQYLTALKMEKKIAMSLIFSSLITLILFFIFIPKFSGVGAAISVLIGHSICALLQFFIMIKNIIKLND